MAHEIIFDPDRPLEAQMREALDLADEDSSDHENMHWYPRPNRPHGGVLQVPRHIAERYTQLHAQGEPGEVMDGAEAGEGEAQGEAEGEAEGEADTLGTEQPASSRRSRRAAASEGGSA